MNLDHIRQKIQLRQYRISWTHTEKLRRTNHRRLSGNRIGAHGKEPETDDYLLLL